MFQRFFGEESGATMVEYGVMVALIAAVCVAIISVLGQQVNNAFNTVSNKI
ncbi:MAG: Flp family type IVb pilin [Chloroflexi bacterium]|nr:Flp family type IVb pilin [Chloroflexota bacterium]